MGGGDFSTLKKSYSPGTVKAQGCIPAGAVRGTRATWQQIFCAGAESKTDSPWDLYISEHKISSRLAWVSELWAFLSRLNILWKTREPVKCFLCSACWLVSEVDITTQMSVLYLCSQTAELTAVIIHHRHSFPVCSMRKWYAFAVD